MYDLKYGLPAQRKNYNDAIEGAISNANYQFANAQAMYETQRVPPPTATKGTGVHWIGGQPVPGGYDDSYLSPLTQSLIAQRSSTTYGYGPPGSLTNPVMQPLSFLRHQGLSDLGKPSFKY